MPSFIERVRLQQCFVLFACSVIDFVEEIAHPVLSRGIKLEAASHLLRDMGDLCLGMVCKVLDGIPMVVWFMRVLFLMECL